MSGKYFSYREALGFGWNAVWSNFGLIAGAMIVMFLVSLPSEILGQVVEFFPEVMGPGMFFGLLGLALLIETVVWIGFTKMSLSFCDKERPRFGLLFDASGCFLKCIGAGILMILCIGGALAVCVVPGILLSALLRTPFVMFPVFCIGGIIVAVVSVKLSLCLYFVIDMGMGPVKALKASSRTTMDAKWNLWLFSIVCGLVNVAGFLCFIVGLVVTVPTVMIAMAYVYRRLSEQTPELAELDSDVPVIMPGGGAASAGGIGFGGMVEPVGAGPVNIGRPSVLWLRLCVLSMVVIIGGTCYLLWPVVKGERGVIGGVVDSKGLVSKNGFNVSGIVLSDNPCAIVNGQILKVGDVIEGAEVVKIEKGQVEFLRDGESWTQILKKGQEGVSSGGPVLLVLGADRCPACREMTPVMKKLQSQYGKKFSIQYVDVDKETATASKYGIRAIPTLIFSDPGGGELYRHVGYCSEQDILKLWGQLGFEF
jgi:thioredoxin 1